jgi:endoglucanase
MTKPLLCPLKIRDFGSLACLIWFLIVVCYPQPALSGDVPFSRGVNLTGWFQVSNAEQIQFTRYTRTDFEQIRSLGCDVIRLPINLHFMTAGAPDYIIDPLFYSFLDEVVKWAGELGINLILDNHTFDVTANTDPNVGIILKKVWSQMAQHYKDSSDYIYYEILNEPHGISDYQWNTIQQQVIDAIRAVDTKHYIVVGPANWNSYSNLKEMPVYSDNKLIYTFHFYDPFVFTHQGASWVDPSMAPLSGVPFPYQADSMPAFPASLRNTWIESEFNNYAESGTVEHVKALIDLAVLFKNSRNVPVYCGEFGVYIPNSHNHHRTFWYETVRKYLEDQGIPWTTWDYQGGFGLFNKGSNELFDHDLNIPLLQALGLNVPGQTPYIQMPDSTGFMLYTDYIGNQIYESGYGTGVIRYYNQDAPNNGRYCISWKGADQYNAIGFDFVPDRDLSALAASGYAMDLMVRGTPQTSFDVRFVDTKTTEPGDHPWRMRVTVDEEMTAFDYRWHHLFIPLSSFTEQGAWDDAWFNPEGKFDWQAVDRMEIVSEQQNLYDKDLWFDNIHITNLDTARVYENSVYTGVSSMPAGNPVIKVYPCPARDYIRISGVRTFPFQIRLTDTLGRIWIRKDFRDQSAIDISELPAGIYIVTVMEGENAANVYRMIKQ